MEERAKEEEGKRSWLGFEHHCKGGRVIDIYKKDILSETHKKYKAMKNCLYDKNQLQFAVSLLFWQGNFQLFKLGAEL